jgi:hypothetical protein
MLGANHGANSAAITQIASTDAETIATGERRKLYATSLSHEPRARGRDVDLARLARRSRREPLHPPAARRRATCPTTIACHCGESSKNASRMRRWIAALLVRRVGMRGEPVVGAQRVEHDLERLRAVLESDARYSMPAPRRAPRGRRCRSPRPTPS